MFSTFFALALVAAVDPTPGTATPPPAVRTKVAVLELSGLGIRQDLIKNLEQYLRTSIATIEGFQVISPVDVQMSLQDPKNKTVAACGGGPECSKETAKLVGADIVVWGTISALGQVYSLNLRALDVKLGKELARQTAEISGSRDLLIPEVRLAAFRLIAPDRIRGSLVVEVDVAGVAIEIDGQPVGLSPLPRPVENLTPGKHNAIFKRDGYKPYEQAFTIKPFEPTRLRLTLEKSQK